MTKEELKELQKMKNYAERKFRAMEKTLTLLMEFARDDMMRLDKTIIRLHKNDTNVSKEVIE